MTAHPWEDDAISERAAGFMERKRFGEWREADQAELDAWMAESTLHRVAWLRVEGIAARADHLAALRALKLRQSVQGRGGLRVPRRFALPLLAAASVALFAALGIPVVNSLAPNPDRVGSTYVGGRTLLKFVDGTQIELNTDTAMRFRMTGEERTVWLEKGEAWFHVSHDASRPFNVIVGKHRVTDLGTEFLVRRDAEDVEVALLAGRAALNAGGVRTTTLTPGDEAMATPVSLSVVRKTPQELADELAWRRGVLVFRNTRLADAVREFNRYNRTRLVVADPSIADVKITAELATDHFDEFLQFAQTVLKLRVAYEGKDVLISRGAAKPKRAEAAP